MNKICVGIVTYNPTIELLIKSIDILKFQVNKIIVVDNHSNNVEKIRELSDNQVAVIELEDNMGIAYALNHIMQLAKEQAFEYVLTLDQDTVVGSDYIESIMNINWSESIAMVCPRVFDRNRGIHDLSSKSVQDSQDKTISYVDQCITSGTVTKIKAWEKVGKYDEVLFIDSVDFDFCQRLRKNGFKIVKNTRAEISHTIGDGKIYKLLFWNISVHNHNALRKYYISRNKIYTDYKIEKRIKIKSFGSNMKLLIKTVLFEDEKYIKVKAIIKGTKDGIKLVRGVK